ncbi:MAG: putative CocE/NonD family hydrolase, partial [Parasphingorhabdus sp.]
MSEVLTADLLPMPIREIENEWIPLSDNINLAARIWLPKDAEAHPVPAILEYLPYRKRDGTIVRDALTHPYLAAHGYACIRVDMRGNGDSEGLMFDEYALQEQDDALEVIDWLCEQDWCDGNVGMMGISWGGFNGLQVAARKPAALKAVITLCSTDDRYADDIHYKGGCLLNENAGWGGVMLSYSSRPPDPALLGERWNQLWMERMEKMPILAANWLEHQLRDDYWKHGSVCEDYSSIDAAVLAVGGWNDAYSNAIPRMLKGLSCPRRGIIGPWIHKYPHFAKPEPRIGFLQEALRWWDQWLKGIDTGVMQDSMLRYYQCDSLPPEGDPKVWPGTWFAAPALTDGSSEVLYLSDTGLSKNAGDDWQKVCTRQDVGQMSGEYCAIWGGADIPGEQNDDDARSITFETECLPNGMKISGAVAFETVFRCDKPKAFLAVRLNDVFPDGRCRRITYAVQNLALTDNYSCIKPLQAGQEQSVRIQLDDIAYQVAPGHKLRLSISNTYWPLIWPSPENATIELDLSRSKLNIPQPCSRTDVSFPPAQSSSPLQQTEIKAPYNERESGKNLSTGESWFRITDNFGTQTIDEYDLTISSGYTENYTIQPLDPLSAKIEICWYQTLSRDNWSVRTESDYIQYCDKDFFYI